MPAKTTRATVIPTMRYRAVNKALELLTETFGFDEHAVYRDEKGNVVHAELSFGNGMVMIGPVSDTPFSRFMRQPGEVGGITQSVYAIVDDPDAHHARTTAAASMISAATPNTCGWHCSVFRSPFAALVKRHGDCP